MTGCKPSGENMLVTEKPVGIAKAHSKFVIAHKALCESLGMNEDEVKFSEVHGYHSYEDPTRSDGAGKAEAHRGLCCIFIAVFFNKKLEKVNSLTPCYAEVHEATQKLTGHLETVIGYPLDRHEEIDYDDLAPKFFDKFYDIATRAIRDYEFDQVN